MERLKALVYCLRCHLVLLIFVALAAGGYWVRGDLYRHFGWALQSGPGSASDRAAVELTVAAADPLSVEAKPIRVEDGQSAIDRMSSPAEPGLAKAGAPPVQQPIAAGDFSFRPLDAPQSGALSEVPSQQELLIEARRAYWNGNIRLAVRSYQRLIDSYPDHPDYPGELGNIYYEQGARQLAASFYLDSAHLLLERGERSRAQGLAEILDGLDAAAAGELRGRLSGTASGSDPWGTPQAASSRNF
jgi:hypothetical protein